MKVIHKFDLSLALISGFMKIQSLGPNLKPLSVQIQNGRLCLWAVVDLPRVSSEPLGESETLTTRYVKIFGTGHEVEHFDDLEYIDTVQDGQYVWHVFINKDAP